MLRISESCFFRRKCGIIQEIGSYEEFIYFEKARARSMFKEYYEKLLQQLSIDFNCTPTELQAKENVITVSKLNEGRRSYNPDKPFLEMVTLGKKHCHYGGRMSA